MFINFRRISKQINEEYIIRTSFSVILVIVSIFLVCKPAAATVLYENSFDDKPDWVSPSQASGLATTHSTAKILGFSGYRATNNIGEALFYIDSNGARGSSGKGLTIWRETVTENSWRGGSLDINIQDPDIVWKNTPNPNGYDELYIAFWCKWSAGWNWGSSFYLEKTFRVYTNDSYQAHYNNNASLSSSEVPGTTTQKEAYLIMDRYDPNRKDMYYTCRVQTGNDVQVADTDFSWNTWVGDGNWHHIEFHVKLNDAGASNLIAECYIDGIKRSELPSPVMLRNGTDRLITSVILFDNIQCRTTSVFEQAQFVDDIVISTTRIGPDYVIGSSTSSPQPPTPDTVPPSAPSGVSIQINQ